MTMAPSPTLNRPPKPAAAPAAKPRPAAVSFAGRGFIPDPPGGPPLFRISVQQYDDWIEQGVLPTDLTVELMDGLLVRKDRSHVGEDPMSIGLDHSNCVEDVHLLDEVVRPRGCHVRSQQPLIISEGSELEPDGMIVRGLRKSLRHRKPTFADVTCVIEVSDSSLKTDRTNKLAIYAAGGIPQYVILNLVDGQVEDHRDPGPAGYARRAVLHRGEVVGFVLADGSTLDVQVDELLP